MKCCLHVKSVQIFVRAGVHIYIVYICFVFKSFFNLLFSFYCCCALVWFSRSYRLLFWFGRRVLPLQKYIITIPLLNCFFIILIISWNVNLCRIWGALVCWWPTFDTRATRVLKWTGSWMYTRLILSRN